jgi:acyl-CoA reductase-like NAD-dependent aldehyde dehydrogenase
VIVKPAPTTPLTILKWIEIAQQIFPPGVLSVISGGDDLYDCLLPHLNEMLIPHFKWTNAHRSSRD